MTIQAAQTQPAQTAGQGPERVPTKVVAATVAGNTLEFYDFVTYAFFAVFIGRTFFPVTEDLQLREFLDACCDSCIQTEGSLIKFAGTRRE